MLQNHSNQLMQIYQDGENAMRKWIAVAFISCVFICVLIYSCGHNHDWLDATCTTPKTCKVCGKTEGEPLGHTFEEANCLIPEFCIRCGYTQGEALGHVWKDATCTEPKICSRCGEHEGKALGHDWAEATCSEPKTCSRCGITSGEALGHSGPDLSCTEPGICSRCGQEIEALGHDWVEANCTEPRTCSRCGLTEGDALGHHPADPSVENKKAATCMQGGSYDEVVYCSDCHTELSRTTHNEDALGHTTDYGKCSRCGYVIYSGHGDDVISNITLDSDMIRIHIQYFGSGVISVKEIDKDLSHVILSKYGAYDGYQYLYYARSSPPVSFEISAKDSDWILSLEPIKSTNESSFSGYGDFVTGIISGPSGTWELTYEGTGYFSVCLYSNNFYRDSIVSTVGEYSGKKYIEFPSGGGCFEITADAHWTLKPVGQSEQFDLFDIYIGYPFV